MQTASSSRLHGPRNDPGPLSFPDDVEQTAGRLHRVEALAESVTVAAQNVAALLAQNAAKSVKSHMGCLSPDDVSLKRDTPEQPALASGAHEDPKRPRLDDIVKDSSAFASDSAAPRATGTQEERGELRENVEAPFALMWIRYNMPQPFNHGAFGLKLRQVVTGAIKMAVVSNYMIDFKWLVTACPALLTASQLVVLHGDNQSGLKSQMQEASVPACCKVCCRALNTAPVSIAFE